MTDPSMKIGKYMAIMSPPIKTPSTDMIRGSINELKLSTALSTAIGLGWMTMTTASMYIRPVMIT